ncbi:MAG: trypsin-like peptidase domain-containing protein [Oscillospiraceae bacterium]|nr:trypsin-like peptidase domain-containing protein [Oscillospiraceae bacterium]
MDENLKQTSENAPEEVVLHYVPQPREVVHYYVQPTCRFTAEEEDEVDSAPPKRRRKGLRNFLIVFILILAIAAAVLFIFRDSFSWYFHGEIENGDGHYYVEYGSDEYSYKLPVHPAGGDARILYEKQGTKQLSPTEIYEKVGPSVVTVINELDGNGSAGIGTGIIFSEDGYIVTNAHVLVDGLGCYVSLYTGGTYSASLVGRDEKADLAVLKIDAEGLRPAEFGDSNALKVGDSVYAIGNPLGFDLAGTFTDGMVSAVDRYLPEDVSLPLIQTNTALNSGNSGGPLINAYGQVVGINTMKLVKTYRNDLGIEGLGFSIPISDCAYLINNIVRTGEAGRETVLGITVLTAPVTLPDGTHALEIESVTKDGPGEKGGVLGGDFLVSANDEPLMETYDLLRIRRSLEPGEAISLVIWRDGLYMTVEVTPE